MYNEINCIILSGGKSNRMGVDKAFLRLDNKFVIEVILNLAGTLFSNLIIAANDTEKYSKLGVDVFPDVYPNRGPLSGIHAGLLHSSAKINFVVSCDMPLLKKSTIEHIIDRHEENMITLPKYNSRIHFACGAYDKSVLPAAEKLLMNSTSEKKQKRTSIFSLIDNVRTNILDMSDLSSVSEDEFFNMNTQDDYQYVKSKYESGS